MLCEYAIDLCPGDTPRGKINMLFFIHFPKTFIYLQSFNTIHSEFS